METTNNKIKLVMCAVYDSKVKQHTNPNVSRTIEEALRSFGAAASDEGHDFKKFASDYTLWCLGYYYPETGKIDSIDRYQIASATDYLKGV